MYNEKVEAKTTNKLAVKANEWLDKEIAYYEQDSYYKNNTYGQRKLDVLKNISVEPKDPNDNNSCICINYKTKFITVCCFEDYVSATLMTLFHTIDALEDEEQ